MNFKTTYKVIGEHRSYSNCRFCINGLLESVINLGTVPLAGGFIEKENLKGLTEYNYPLSLGLCSNCKMLQTVQVIDPHILFENYYYSSSKIKTLKTHFKELADEISRSQTGNKNSFIVEIGANDGILIKNLVDKNLNVIGIDPAKNIVSQEIKKGLPLICEYFNQELAGSLIKRFGKADVITSSNTMAHIENISSVYRGIKKLLKKTGYAIVEVHYLAKLLEEFQYDMIYHEHLYYYSISSMKTVLSLFDLELYDALLIPIHAGSIRFYIQHKNGPRKISKNINHLLKYEKILKINSADTYKVYNLRMQEHRKSLLDLIKKLRKKSKSIAGYGASGRGNTIMCYSQIDKLLLNYIIDDSPLKQGRFTPGNHLKIVSSKILSDPKRPDYTVLFAWSFYSEIIQKNSKYLEMGGKFIIPLPTVKIAK